jgi:energy-coupling factor transporter ATP-binding protein EcfA2
MHTSFDLTNIGGYTLKNLGQFSVILGKNGCGKSSLLKALDGTLRGQNGFGRIRYISPERGGFLVYEAGIDQAINNDPNWIANNRRSNQSSNFRQQSGVLFRRLELKVLREIEQTHQLPNYKYLTFESTINLLNSLLDGVYIKRETESGFKILEKDTGNPVEASSISSGEAELVSLGIEILVFVSEAEATSRNILFIDEPDVHLHPDLQHRLAKFILESCFGKNVSIVMATHSTALLAGLAQSEDCQVAFMKRKTIALNFQNVSEIERKILPIFGAHPLSNVFNESPILLIEGEDEERVWQQAVRSSGGEIKLFPCVVDSVDQLSSYEQEVNKIASAIYEFPKAFSLRDRDDTTDAIQDSGIVVRMRLDCRAAENLLLSDDVLNLAGTNWQQLRSAIENWLLTSTTHKYYENVRKFCESEFDRKSFDLKEIRNILVGLFSSKPWEVLVGQAIANLKRNPHPTENDSLRDYLGQKLCSKLLEIES